MSKFILITDDIIEKNGGAYNDGKIWHSNQCFIIAISKALKITDYQLLTEMFDLNNAQVDLSNNTHKQKLIEICTLFNITINIHWYEYLNHSLGLYRAWNHPCVSFTSNDTNLIQTTISIGWNGNHFENIDFSKINNYPEYKKNIYDSIIVHYQNIPNDAKIKKKFKNNFMHEYNYCISI